MAQRKPRPLLRELGNTGLLQTSGFIYDEFLPKLRGLTGARIYQEMSENDPVLGAFLYAMSMVVRQVQWHIEPKDKSGPAMEARDFIDEVLFQDMSHTWADFMAELMEMLVYGYSLFEKVWKIRSGGEDSRFDDNKIGLKRLAPRAQVTIWRWVFDEDGEVAAVEQMLYNTGINSAQSANGVATLPFDKLLLFKTTSRRNNPEGRSVLRSSYIPYLRKKVIEDSEGRLALRSAGIVQLRLPEEYMDPGADEATKGAFNAYKDAAAKIAQDRQGSIVLPSDCDEHGNQRFVLEYTVADGRRTLELGNVVDRLDKRMAMSVLADFLMLGHGGTSRGSGGGSYALSADKTDMFGQALGAFLGIIKDTVNRQLIPQIGELNAMDTDTLPTLEHSDLEAPDLQKLGAFITAVSSAGMPLFPDAETENAIRRQAHLPEMTPEALAAQAAHAQVAADVATSQRTEADAKNPPQEQGQALKPGDIPPKPVPAPKPVPGLKLVKDFLRRRR